MNRTHIANVFWSGFEAATSAALSFASAFIVARLVGPSEVGIGAAVVAVHILLWVAVNALFADPLVQRAALDDASFSSAFWASVAVGAAAAVVQGVLGQPIAWWLGAAVPVLACGTTSAAAKSAALWLGSATATARFWSYVIWKT